MKEDSNMQQMNGIYPEDRIKKYERLYQQFQMIFEGEQDVIANLSNASALLMEALSDINWVGFYLMKQGELILGPF